MPSCRRSSALWRSSRTLAAIALLVAARAGAQARQSASATEIGRQLVQEALALAEQGDTAQALARAARASRVAPDLADARFLYGVLLSRTAGEGFAIGGQRTDANREFEAALRLDTDNPQYLIEVARLRMKQPILRIQAERFFRQALAAARKRHDPAVEADVEAEIGNIYLHRYEAVADRRIIIGTTPGFDWEAALRDPHYTKSLLLDQSTEIPGMGETDLAKAELHYRAGVRVDSTSVGANTGLLALLAATGRQEEFLDAARNFVRAVPANAYARLYLGLGLWRAHLGGAADTAFRQGLAGLPVTERDRIEDLSQILRAAAAVEYRQLPDSERAEYERLFWWSAEPLRLTDENEYHLEHFARVAEADLRFSAPDLRLRGWSTDRGQIYIRYGPPPVRATFPPNPLRTSDDILSAGNLTTVWYYPKRNLRFVFTGPPTFNYQRLAGDFSSYAENVRFQEPVAYDNVPIAATLDSIAVQPAQFLASGDSAGTDVVFFAGIPVRDMVRGVDLRGGEMETGLFVSDTHMREFVNHRDREPVTFGAETQFETRTSAVYLPTGDYFYRFEARLPDTEHAARGLDRFRVESFRTPALSLSDVVVADRVAPREEGAPQRGRQDFFIDPNAAMEFRRTDPVHLYAEAYHLAPGQNNGGGQVAHLQVAVRLRVQALQRTGLAARIVGGIRDAIGASAAGDDQLTLSYVAQESLEGRDRVPIYLALDLAGAPAGVYQLDLAVKDLTTGQIAVRHRTLHIVEGAPRP